jgi:hypothetical protein
MKNLSIQNTTLAIIFIAFVTLAANLYSVFGLSTLIQDDSARYFHFFNGGYTYPDFFLGVGWWLKSIFVWIFSNYSVELARFSLVILFMIPLGIAFYIFNRAILNLPLWVSILSAVAINCIPKQWLIPAFLDGSYVVSGSLMLVLFYIFVGASFLASKASWLYLGLALVFWLLFNDMAAEMGVVIVPAVSIFIWVLEGATTKKLLIQLGVIIISLARFLHYIKDQAVRSNRQIAEFSLDKLLDRMSQSFNWWLPFDVSNFIAGLIGMGIVFALIGYLIWAWSRRVDSIDPDLRTFVIYVSWFLCASAPFWLVTPYVAVRHFYIAFCALTPLVFLLLYRTVVERFSLGGRGVMISLLVLTMIYGYQRFHFSSKLYEPWNIKSNQIHTLLKDEKINDHTQIAIVNMTYVTAGYYIWSSGYLQYLLRNPSIRGIVGPNSDFYDPFNPKHCHYGQRMSCLDPTGELIAFKRGEDGKPKKMRYFLRWLDRGNDSSEWVLLATDSVNQLSEIARGNGMDSYKGELSRLDLDSINVLWGRI